MSSNLDAYHWTDADIDLLKTMWAAGESASAIASAVGHGVTRSAVSGKIHRMKLQRGGANPRKAVARRKAGAGSMIDASSHGNVHGGLSRKLGRAKAAGASSLAEAVGLGMQGAPRAVASRDLRLVVDNDAAGIPFLEIRMHGQCRWPLWGLDPIPVEQMLYCGHATAEGQTYCERHRRRATTRHG